MKRTLDAADLELVKLMVMGEGLDLDDVLARRVQRALHGPDPVVAVGRRGCHVDGEVVVGEER